MLLHKKCEQLHSGVRVMRERAQALRASGPVGFNVVSEHVLTIRSIDTGIIASVLSLGTSNAVNTVVNRFVGGWGADPVATLGGVRTAVAGLMAAAQTLKDALGDVLDWTPAGEVYDEVSAPQLATLHASLDALITALAPLNTAD